MARALATPIDPAADAAALLRRIGFVVLMLLLPAAALVTRRAVVVLAPLGIALLVLAALLDGDRAALRDKLGRVAGSPTGVAASLVLAWCALSLLWTPFVAPASERLFNIAATVAVAAAGYLALPDRMRSANLYIVPVGVGLAAVAAVAIALFGPAIGLGSDEDGQNLERGLVVLVLFVWPSIAWLRSRDRDVEALALAVAVALATVLGPRPMPLVALLIGMVAYVVAAASRKLGVKVVATVMAGSLALAPLIPLLTRWITSLALGADTPLVRSLTVWRKVVLSEPVRLVTGHGFETALRGRFVGMLPANAPSTILFEIWYELGIVGALAGAVALYTAVTRAGRDHLPLVPGVTAAFATAFAFASLGIGTAQMWWFTALAILVLIFVAAERGQFRTTRPKALIFRKAANDA